MVRIRIVPETEGFKRQESERAAKIARNQLGAVLLLFGYR